MRITDITTEVWTSTCGYQSEVRISTPHQELIISPKMGYPKANDLAQRIDEGGFDMLWDKGKLYILVGGEVMGRSDWLVPDLETIDAKRLRNILKKRYYN